MNDFMRQPTTDKKSIEPIWAYTILGWLLGTLPPVAIFLSITFWANVKNNAKLVNENSLFFIGLLTVICSVVGLLGGLTAGAIMLLVRQKPPAAAIILAAALGFIWAIVTGGLGGVLFFIIGGIFGAIIAIPVGVFGFLIFAAIYEPLLRKRKIRFWHIPALAFGVAFLFSIVMPAGLILLLELNG